MYNFLLVDDHSIVRAGLKIMIRQQFVSASFDEAENAQEAFSLLKAKTYEIVIMDLNMPNSDPFDIIEYIKKNRAEIKIIVLTMNNEETFAKRFYKAGVKGFIHKANHETEIIKAINTVIQGRLYMSDTLKKIFAESVFIGKPENPFDTLSDRELQIAIEFLHGKSIQEISTIFNISVSTVSTYKAKIYEKLNIPNNNIISLMALAKEWQIVIN
jgi:DNA-binding NarL/FixJ family response regulator